MRTNSTVLVNSTKFKLQKHLVSFVCMPQNPYKYQPHTKDLVSTIEQKTAVVFFLFFFNDNENQYSFHVIFF